MKAPYNCGFCPHRINERCLEIAIAKIWLAKKNKRNIIEIGANKDLEQYVLQHKFAQPITIKFFVRNSDDNDFNDTKNINLIKSKNTVHWCECSYCPREKTTAVSTKFVDGLSQHRRSSAHFNLLHKSIWNFRGYQ